MVEFVRVTLYQCVKASQAVMNGLMNMGLAVNRHRVSLLMQLRRCVLPCTVNYNQTP